MVVKNNITINVVVASKVKLFLHVTRILDALNFFSSVVAKSAKRKKTKFEQKAMTESESFYTQKTEIQIIYVKILYT
jgi:hypothetical protein